jgi:hypothetical protein
MTAAFEAQISELLEQTLIPDTAVVRTATTAIKRELKRPATMVVLLKILIGHPVEGVR